MDDEHRDLVRHLLATATELIETAHDAAVAGQSGEIAAGRYSKSAHQLNGVAWVIAVLAEAAMIVANLDVYQHRNRPKHSR